MREAFKNQLRAVFAVCAVLMLVGIPTAARADEIKTVKSGQSFSIELPWKANVKWVATLEGELGKMVDVKDPGPAPVGKPGSTQTRTYNFQTIRTGEGTLKMRQYEVGSNRLLDTKTYTVKIR